VLPIRSVAYLSRVVGVVVGEKKKQMAVRDEKKQTVCCLQLFTTAYPPPENSDTRCTSIDGTSGTGGEGERERSIL
jgi:hypothetical protein